VRARNDTWFPLKRAYKLQEFIGGILTIIENAGHLVQQDAPEELTAVLFNWMQSQKKI
jgi:pimeloyl-ACP methyl ester carboxylesterase